MRICPYLTNSLMLTAEYIKKRSYSLAYLKNSNTRKNGKVFSLIILEKKSIPKTEGHTHQD